MLDNPASTGPSLIRVGRGEIGLLIIRGTLSAQKHCHRS